MTLNRPIYVGIKIVEDYYICKARSTQEGIYILKSKYPGEVLPWYQGYQAYIDGDNCPYHIGLDNWRDWQRGRRAARLRAIDLLKESLHIT